MKDLLRELEELRLARDEAVNEAKETERKLKSMEADALRFQEVRVINDNPYLEIKLNLTKYSDPMSFFTF